MPLCAVRANMGGDHLQRMSSRVSISELAQLIGLSPKRIKETLGSRVRIVKGVSYVYATPDVWALLVGAGAHAVGANHVERGKSRKAGPRREVLGSIVEDHRGELDTSDKDYVTNYERIVYGS